MSAAVFEVSYCASRALYRRISMTPPWAQPGAYLFVCRSAVVLAGDGNGERAIWKICSPWRERVCVWERNESYINVQTG